jgi:hypothetical protein
LAENQRTTPGAFSQTFQFTFRFHELRVGFAGYEPIE